jgi:hypothetical protein
MTRLFHRLQPPQKFRINISDIAQLLKIPKHLIVRVECWAYIIFVHRLDKGGQFISYRKLQQWRNAVASQIQNCQTFSEMRWSLCEPPKASLWTAIEDDYLKWGKAARKPSYPLASPHNNY